VWGAKNILSSFSPIIPHNFWIMEMLMGNYSNRPFVEISLNYLPNSTGCFKIRGACYIGEPLYWYRTKVYSY